MWRLCDFYADLWRLFSGCTKIMISLRGVSHIESITVDVRCAFALCDPEFGLSVLWHKLQQFRVSEYLENTFSQQAFWHSNVFALRDNNISIQYLESVPSFPAAALQTLSCCSLLYGIHFTGTFCGNTRLWRNWFHIPGRWETSVRSWKYFHRLKAGRALQG